MRLFLDTNILIDFYAQRAPFTSLVCKLIAMEMFSIGVEIPHEIPC